MWAVAAAPQVGPKRCRLTPGQAFLWRNARGLAPPKRPAACRRHSGKLKALEPIELRLDAMPVAASRPPPDPRPLLDFELAGPAVGLEVDGSHHLIADQHRKREIAKHP